MQHDRAKKCRPCAENFFFFFYIDNMENTKKQMMNKTSAALALSSMHFWRTKWVWVIFTLYCTFFFFLFFCMVKMITSHIASNLPENIWYIFCKIVNLRKSMHFLDVIFIIFLKNHHVLFQSDHWNNQSSCASLEVSEISKSTNQAINKINKWKEVQNKCL